MDFLSQNLLGLRMGAIMSNQTGNIVYILGHTWTVFLY